MAVASLPRPVSMLGDRETSKNPLGFFFFLVTTVTLFVRPAEILPWLGEVPLYQYAILICFLFSLPAVLHQLSPRSLRANPISCCVLGVGGMMVLSALFHGALYLINVQCVEFSKIALFYFLLVGLVDSPRRMRIFVGVLFVSTTVLAVLSLLEWYGMISLRALEVLHEGSKDAYVLRLQGTGIFHDPNDYSLILLFALFIGLYALLSPDFGTVRLLVLPSLVALGHAFLLTRSRGGLLGLLMGFFILFRSRYSWTRTALASLVVFPLVFLLADSRQSELSTQTSTGQDRLQIWTQGFELLRGSPVFGVGPDQYEDIIKQIAHNSYLHAFTELGIPGGIFFAGMFLYPLGVMYGLRSARLPDPSLGPIRPYLAGAVGGYAVGLLSLSRNYVVPTYLIVGLAGAYLAMAVQPTPAWMRCSVRLFLKISGAAFFLLIGIYLIARFSVRWE